MRYSRLQRLLPRFLSRYMLHVEAGIEDAVGAFANSLPESARVLDAGAGETAYKPFFSKCRFCALDLGIGDAAWNYGNLDVLGDLAHLPFRDAAFDASLNIVTLEHVPEPARVLAELARVLKPGARLLLVIPARPQALRAA